MYWHRWQKFAIMGSVQTKAMTHIQAYFDGSVTAYTDLDDDSLMQVTRIPGRLKKGHAASYLTVSKEDARTEWRQNAANGWKHFN